MAEQELSQDLSVEERIFQLLQHLGIPQAHFGARSAADWTGLAAAHPEVFSSLTLVGPTGVDLDAVGSLVSKLLVFNGDQGAPAARVNGVMEGAPAANLVTLQDYVVNGWADVTDHTEIIAPAMTNFFQRVGAEGVGTGNAISEGEGEFAGISYRIRGSGPPVVLFPMFLSPTQWEPLVPRLSEGYCTITLGGPQLGAVALLENRGHAHGFRSMVGNLMDVAQLSPGESVLEVGCGTGVLSRLLAQRTHGESHITGMDINPYFLNEAAALVRREGLDNSIEFREGNAEALPFADNSFDVTMSITVIEEVDASKLIADMVRVTKPGGRIAVASRALDLPCISNLPLSPEVKAKVDVPGILGTCVELGCADASLYQRLHQAGVLQVKMFPHLAAFDGSAKVVLQLMQEFVLRQLNREEAAEWRKARAEAEADGTFFMAWPHHCAVGTKP